MRGVPVIIDKFPGFVYQQDGSPDVTPELAPGVARSVQDVHARFGYLQTRNPLDGRWSLPAGVKPRNMFIARSGAVLVVGNDNNLYNNGSLVAAYAGVYWEFAEAVITAGSPYIFGVSQSVIPQRIDPGGGATVNWVATSGTVPTGTDICFAGNRLWVINGALPPGTAPVYFSELGDPYTWPVANVVELDPDGFQAVAIAPLGPYVAVFKKDRIYLIYDLNTGANRRISTEYGCAGPQSLLVRDDGIYFYDSRNGLLHLDAAGNIKKLSNAIDQLTLGAAAPTNTTAAATPTMAYYLDSIFISFATATYEYNIPTKTWWAHSFNGLLSSGTVGTIDALFILGWSPTPNIATFAAYTEGKGKIAGTSDYGRGLGPVGGWSSGLMSLGSPALKKRMRVIDIEGYCAANNMTLTREYDTVGNPTSQAITFQNPFGGGQLMRQARVPAQARTGGNIFSLGRFASFTIVGQAAAPWAIQAISVEFTSRKN